MPSCSRKGHTSTPSDPSWLCSSIHSPKRTTSYGLRSCVLRVRYENYIHPLLLEPCDGVVHGNLSALRHAETVQAARMHLHTSRCLVRPKNHGRRRCVARRDRRAQSLIGTFSSRFYLSLRMVCAIVLVARVADRTGSWSSLPLSEGGLVAKWYVS